MLSFTEWVEEQRRLNKTPARGGVQTAINPNIAPPGYAPGLPAPPGSHSKYTDSRPSQPPGWIDDVDMASNWYSPFQPVQPFGPPSIAYPREWDFPVGYNLNYVPQRMELMRMLRGMARTWGVLATIISTRQDQLLRIPWTIQQTKHPTRDSAGVREMKAFFRRPDGKLKYSQWSRKLTDDLLILDAPTIYFSRDRRGRPIHAEVLDGATIFPLIDDAGRRPDSVVELSDDGVSYLRRQPAFQQIIKGFPMIDLDESELMYVPMRPRPDLPIFGYPPTEQIVIEASEAIRKTFYQFNFWAEGTIPDLIVTVPDTWSVNQIAMFQAHIDATLSGNLALKSKVRFLPGGMKPFDIKNSSGESLWSQRDETLIRIACYAYSVSPSPFVKMMNRSVAQNAQQMAEEEGLYPHMSFWKDDIMDSIIQDRFGFDDVEFVFLPRPEPDAEKQSKIHDMKIKNGQITINEARGEIGLEPVSGGDTHLIYIGNAIIPLDDAAEGKALPMVGGADAAGNGKPGSTATRTDRPSGQPQGGRASTESSGKPTTKYSHTNHIDVAATHAASHDGLSDAQLNAGNYPKGHITFHGLNISIENRRGSTRNGSRQMPTHYGYIRRTLGADGDFVDCFIGPDPDSDLVWIIDQNRVNKKGKIKGFDEHKIMLGYRSSAHAIHDYCASYQDNLGSLRIGAVSHLTVDGLKQWLNNSTLTEPLSETHPELCVWKADTISSSTGLNSYSQGVKRKRRRKQGPRWLALNMA